MIINLNGSWKFRRLDNMSWYSAKVPGCNFLDLIANNLIPDPFYGTNEKDLYWVSEKDWEYTKTFELTTEQLASKSICLVCKCLDTICDVFVNGNLVGKGENHHLKYVFDIKNFVGAQNEIKIRFYSPVNYVLEKQKVEKCPANANGLNGIPHIRKPQCHFGWDWGPVLTPSGISGDIFVECESVAKIQDVKIVQNHSENVCNLSVGVEIENILEKSIDCEVSVVSPNGELLDTKTCNTDKKFNFEFEIKNPQLWWTNDIKKGKQPLYTVKVCLKNEEKEVGSIEKRIGLRTLKLNQDIDKYGKNFQFVLNGESIFAKGANWIPSDSFVNATTKEKLEYYIKSAYDCNFNMIRVWGGGYYESDEFYDLCDEYGIIVWQDFAFACQPYPFFIEDFKQNVLKEVEYNVKRLRHHASLGLWCGNNEIELMAIAWKMRTDYVKWTEKFFWDELPRCVAKYDKVTPYIAGTPIGIAHNKGFSNDNVGDTHLWAVWHGLQPMNYYRKRMTRFCSEFGFESLPDLKTIKTYAKPSDYSLTSEVFKNHQKCASGNMKMAFYIASRFRLPKNFEDYVYLSGICQQECIRDATEHWRRNKGQCNGSLFWQYNDCWPVCSWSSIDYYGNFKALQYKAKDFFNPLMVSIQDEKTNIDLYVINDKLENYDGIVNYKLIDFNGKVLLNKKVECKIKSNSSAMVQSIKMSEIKTFDYKNCVFVVDLIVNDEIVSHKTMLFGKEKDLVLPKAKVSFAVEVENKIAKITLKTDKFARLVKIYSNSITKPFSDNYFDLISGEEKVVTIECGDMTQEEVLGDLQVNSICDVEPKSSKFSDTMFRVKVFLIPINFANWIYYNKIPSKLKVKE